MRIDGELDVHARSVARQEPPYRPLAEVVESSRSSSSRKVEGTLVGFRFPAVAGGVEVPGYHLHAITADRTRGGHVLRARVRSGTVRIGQLTDLHMELPPGKSSPTGPDDEGALNAVEHQGYARPVVSRTRASARGHTAPALDRRQRRPRESSRSGGDP